MATLRISLKNITSEVKFAEQKAALLQNSNVWKKILPFVQSYKVAALLYHPKSNFMSKWHLIQPLQREICKKPTLISYIKTSGAKIFGHISHSTELVCMCLACQHFNFKSTDWISDSLRVISSRYLRTMGKEFIVRFSRHSWGKNAWRTPKNVCVRG